MLDEILNKYEEEQFLKADGFDDAVIGIDVNSMRLIYSIEMCKKILIDEGLDVEELLNNSNQSE